MNNLKLFYYIFIIALSRILGEVFIPPNCNSEYHNTEEVKDTVIKAKDLLNSKSDTSINSFPLENRLLIQILFSSGFDSGDSNVRIEWLKCSLAMLNTNMLSKTTADVFLWVPESSLQSIPTWLSEPAYARVHVIALHPTTWKVPCGLSDDTMWSVRKHFSLDYYLMGRWRLTFSLDFARAMGYKYHLQFDDDAILNSPITYDIVSKLKTTQTYMGVFSDNIGEPIHVVNGLAELTRYWLQINNFDPIGTIYKHVSPGDMNGLTTKTWDRMYHPGYFQIMSIDFYFQGHIQNYLTTILKSGSDVERRWQEQAVFNMMRLIFIPEPQFNIMYDVDIGHDRHKRSNFDNWCSKVK
jgi:hypothetical protein